MYLSALFKFILNVHKKNKVKSFFLQETLGKYINYIDESVMSDSSEKDL